jgi:hypothetical protein
MNDKPTDPLDIAADAAERERAARIADIIRQPTLPETGRCLNCDEPVIAGRFCDSDCAADWHKRARAR